MTAEELIEVLSKAPLDRVLIKPSDEPMQLYRVESVEHQYNGVVVIVVKHVGA